MGYSPQGGRKTRLSMLTQWRHGLVKEGSCNLKQHDCTGAGGGLGDS